MKTGSGLERGSTRRILKACYTLGTALLAYLVSANAWWHYRGAYSQAPSSFFDPIFTQFQWLGRRTDFLWFPGWLTVNLVRGGGLATRSTDLLIPIVSTVFWTWVGLLAFSLIAQVRQNAFWKKLSTVQRMKFAMKALLLGIVAIESLCEFLGLWHIVGIMSVPFLVGVPVLILSLMVFGILSALFRFANWLVSMRTPVG